MMDPLSIAASACSIANLCGSLIINVSRFIIDARSVPKTIEEFTTTITAVKTVLTNIEVVVSKRPKTLPFAQKQERKHWSDIKNVLEACTGCLYKLQNELPLQREDTHKPLVQARLQLEMSLKSNVVMQIRGHLATYTQVLELSLTTMTLGSMWETQQSQEFMRSEIQKLTEEIRKRNETWEQWRQQEREISNPDRQPDLTLEEMLANRNIEAWRESAESLAAAVTLYDPDEQSQADHADLGSIYSRSNFPGLDETRRAEIAERLEPPKTNEIAEIMGPDSGIEVSDNASDYDPEPGNTYWLSVDILQHQIAANEQNVKKLLKDGIFTQAEQYQRKGIELRDQLEKMHNIPFSNKADAEETMADIFMQQKGTRGAMVRAKDILQKLLNQEVQRELQPGDDQDRRWRLYQKLAAVYIDQGSITKAKLFATRSLEGRKKQQPMPKEKVLETAALLARACQLNQDFDEAQGLRNWIHAQEPIDPSEIDSTDHAPTSTAIANAIHWCKERGFDVDSPGFRFDTPNANGKTPLHVAVSDEELEIVEQIVDHVATLETPDKDDKSTALLLAAATRNRRTTEILLKHDALVAVTDKYLNTPLHRAQAANGGVAVAKLLLSHQDGVSNYINAKNGYDKTALHLACQLGNEPMVSLLLSRGADANAPGPGHCTPLHVAIDQRRPGIVKKLLEAGDADISLRDGAGRNAVRAAKTTKFGSPDVIKLLQEHEEKLRRLSHSTGAGQVHGRKSSSASIGRRDTVVSDASGISTGSGESIGSPSGSPRTARDRFSLGLILGRKDTRDSHG